VRFVPLSTEQLVERLVVEGLEPEGARRAADAAGGDLERARILAADPGLEARAASWRSIPDRLDGRGSSVTTLVAELTGQLDEALGPLDARHRAELGELAQRIERYGLAKGLQKATEDRHKRERRRFRTDELRFGLAVLSRACRDRLAARVSSPATADGFHLGGPGATAVMEPFVALRAAAEALERNPNETLLLEALLLRLHPLE
jgi:DNA polymerase-3 subunit delta'